MIDDLTNGLRWNKLDFLIDRYFTSEKEFFPIFVPEMTINWYVLIKSIVSNIKVDENDYDFTRMFSKEEIRVLVLGDLEESKSCLISMIMRDSIPLPDIEEFKSIKKNLETINNLDELASKIKRVNL